MSKERVEYFQILPIISEIPRLWLYSTVSHPIPGVIHSRHFIIARGRRPSAK